MASLSSELASRQFSTAPAAISWPSSTTPSFPLAITPHAPATPLKKSTRFSVKDRRHTIGVRLVQEQALKACLKDRDIEFDEAGLQKISHSIFVFGNHHVELSADMALTNKLVKMRLKYPAEIESAHLTAASSSSSSADSQPFFDIEIPESIFTNFHKLAYFCNGACIKEKSPSDSAHPNLIQRFIEAFYAQLKANSPPDIMPILQKNFAKIAAFALQHAHQEGIGAELMAQERQVLAKLNTEHSFFALSLKYDSAGKHRISFLVNPLGIFKVIYQAKSQLVMEDQPLKTKKICTALEGDARITASLNLLSLDSGVPLSKYRIEIERTHFLVPPSAVQVCQTAPKTAGHAISTLVSTAFNRLSHAACSVTALATNVLYDSLVDDQESWRYKQFASTFKNIIQVFARKENLSLAGLREMWKDKTGTPLQAYVYGLLNILLEKGGDPIKQHSEFIKQLRHILLSAEYADQLCGKVPVRVKSSLSSSSQADNLASSVLPEVESPSPKKLSKEETIQDKANSEAFKFIQNLCFYYFSSNTLHALCNELVHRALDEGMKAQMRSTKPLLPRLWSSHQDRTLETEEKETDAVSFKEQFEIIDSLPQKFKGASINTALRQAAGATNLYYDPALLGSVPHILYTFSRGEEILRPPTFRRLTCIAMASPTTQETPLSAVASLTPEFLTYMQVMKERKLVHLYINVQDDRATSYEKERCEVIKSLQEAFRENFRYLSLPHDSEFYLQTGEFAKTQASSLFLANLQAEMFSSKKDSGFHFPNALIKDFNWRLVFVGDECLEMLYGSKKELTVAEKQVFIDIFYSLLTLKLLCTLKIDMFNISCKSGFNRAGKNNSLLFKILCILHNKEDSEEHALMHRVITHGPAMLVEQQTITLDRRERLINALALLQTKSVQDKLKELRETFNLSPDTDVGVLS